MALSFYLIIASFPYCCWLVKSNLLRPLHPIQVKYVQVVLVVESLDAFWQQVQ